MPSRSSRLHAVVWILAVGLGSLPSTAVRADTMITNGSFESGNTGFSSNYTFSPIPPGGVASGATNVDAGQYRIVQNLVQAHDAWAATGSLTAQSGTNYMVANGSANTAFSPWIQTISPTSGQITTSSASSPVYYRFQAYIANLYPVAPPQLSFEMSFNNSGLWQQLTTSVALVPEVVDVWNLTYADGYFGSVPSQISFRLRNTISAEGGNDFAIDSIYFGLSSGAPDYGSNPINSIGEITGVPEPTTYALASTGLACGGYSIWRRRKRGSP